MSHDKHIDTPTLQEECTLADRCQQVHALCTTHGDTWVRLEAYDDTQGVEPACHALDVLNKLTMTTMHTIERPHANDGGSVESDIIEAMKNLHT